MDTRRAPPHPSALPLNSSSPKEQLHRRRSIPLLFPSTPLIRAPPPRVLSSRCPARSLWNRSSPSMSVRRRREAVQFGRRRRTAARFGRRRDGKKPDDKKLKQVVKGNSCDTVVQGNNISAPSIEGTILPVITRKSTIEVVESKDYQTMQLQDRAHTNDLSQTVGGKRSVSHASESSRPRKVARTIVSKVVMAQLKEKSKTLGRKLPPIVSGSPILNMIARRKSQASGRSPNLHGRSPNMHVQSPSLHALSPIPGHDTPTSLHALSPVPGHDHLLPVPTHGKFIT
ncbi:hypothetical protein ACQ4PT_058414 [Festuca glaucescens]